MSPGHGGGQADGDGALVGIPRPFPADHDLPLDQPRHGSLGSLPAGPFLAASVGAGLVPFRRVDAGDPHLDAVPAPFSLSTLPTASESPSMTQAFPVMPASACACEMVKKSAVNKPV